MGGRSVATWILSAILFFGSGRLPAEQAADRTVIVSFAEDNAPYTWVSDGHLVGLELDIVAAAFALAGYRVEAVPRPYRRLPTILSNEKIDGTTGVRPEELPGFYSSKPYMYYDNYAIVRKDSGIVLHGISDLFDHSVVSWAGAAKHLGLERKVPDKLAAARDKTYFELPDEAMTYKYFWSRRAEILLADKYIYQWYLRTHPDVGASASAVTYFKIFEETASFAEFRTPGLRDDFEHGLRRLQETGDYQRILDRYLR